MKLIDVKIITPKGLYKETKSPIINCVSKEGERGILPEHMPIVISLAIAKLALDEDNKRNYYALAGGILYFKNNECTIITPAIERSDEIDVKRANEALKRAEEHLADPNSDIVRAKAALSRALNRIDVANLK